MKENNKDVVAVNINTRKVVWVERNRTAEAAMGVMHMAIARQGMKKRFYGIVDAGTYNEGDKWQGGTDDKSQKPNSA